MPKVSVIIPTHNRPDFLPRAIKSVLDQSYQDFEIIVIDDGLKTRAESIVKEINDPRITYIQHDTEKGGAAARNTGIKAARGEFIAFLDDDDEWLPDKLKIQVYRFQDSDQDVGFCFTAIKQLRDNDIITSQVPEYEGDFHELALTRFKGFLTSSLLIKKLVLDNVGYFDESFPSHQEPDLIIRITKIFKGIGINKPLVLMWAKSNHEQIGSNLQRRIMGGEMIIKKHYKEFAIKPKILAKHYFQLGLWYRDSGSLQAAKEKFKEAIKIYLKFRYLLHYLNIFYIMFKKFSMTIFKKILSVIFPEKFYKLLLKLYVKYKFFGLKYKCPFCNGHYRLMFSAGFDYPIFKTRKIVGAGLRDNIRCPYCNSSTRERLIYLYLKKFNIINKKLTILHVAPEKNLQKILKSKKNISHISIDIASVLADKKMDICNLTFADNMFNLVICSHVLEHVADDKKAMYEFYRVLKPNGFAILQVPIAPDLEKTIEDPSENNPEERIRLFGQDDHVRLYGRDYVDRLTSCGFKVVKYNFVKENGLKIAKKYALDLEEDLYVCFK